MLQEVVTRALSRLHDGAVHAEAAGPFRYAFASEDGHYVAIVSRDQTTYVVDLKHDRFCVASPATPCGFTGHVLELEAARRVVPHAPYVEHFDLDLDRDELDWRGCTRVG